jgi:putative ubiquitin-RnfH superfamily antitoxin RatB of RatAB toxin-antitoxin module
MATIRVEVVYALPGGEDAVVVRLPDGATIQDALLASGLLGRHQLSPTALKTGIYGTLKPPHAAISDGDRVEIYRPLLVDPKEARRRRARKR